jgi:hypothetical protein
MRRAAQSRVFPARCHADDATGLNASGATGTFVCGCSFAFVSVMMPPPLRPCRLASALAGRQTHLRDCCVRLATFAAEVPAKSATWELKEFDRLRGVLEFECSATGRYGTVLSCRAFRAQLGLFALR